MKFIVNNHEEVNYVLICLILTGLLLIFGFAYLYSRYRSVRSQLLFNNQQMVLVALMLRNELGIGLDADNSPVSVDVAELPSEKRTLYEEIKFNKKQIALVESFIKKQWMVDVSKDIHPQAGKIS